MEKTLAVYVTAYTRDGHRLGGTEMPVVTTYTNSVNACLMLLNETFGDAFVTHEIRRITANDIL